MRHYGTIDLQQNSILSFDTTPAALPSTPSLGDTVFLNSVLYVCINAGPVEWSTLTNLNNLYSEDITTASTTWVLTHNLNTDDVVVNIYDDLNQKIIPDDVTLTDANTVTVTFGTNQAGKAIVLGGGTGGPAAGGGGGGGASTLPELSDVSFTGLAIGQLMYSTDGTNWSNSANLSWNEAGNTLSLGNLNSGDGTASSPSIHFVSAPTSGVYNASGAVGISSAGAAVAIFSGSNVDFTSKPLVNVADPTNAQDAATKSYVDAGNLSVTTAAETTASLADGATENVDILNFGQGYVLYKIETSAAAWVRIYSDSASRTSDAGRLETEDPGINSGVIAEAITNGAETVIYTPAPNGFNNESPATSTLPIAVTNRSGAATTITVTLTKVTMVA